MKTMMIEKTMNTTRESLFWRSSRVSFRFLDGGLLLIFFILIFCDILPIGKMNGN
jgi:hypothetical protein